MNIIDDAISTEATRKNVRLMIPVMIHWAKTGHNEHTYGDLAHAIGKSKFLGIGHALYFVQQVLDNLSTKSCREIPTLNSLCKNAKTMLPSEGFEFVSPQYNDLDGNGKRVFVKGLDRGTSDIDGGTSDGVGFFVGNLFITAGHVFNEGQIHSIYFNGQRIVLNKNEAIFFNSPNGDIPNPNKPDVAIFNCTGVNSPLVFAEDMPIIGQELTNISRRRVVVDDIHSGRSSIFTKKEVIQMHTCIGKVTHTTDYCECHTDKILRKGDSGSPLMNGNTVYGVLIAGEPGTPRCVFQSSASIVTLFRKGNE